MGLLWLVYLLIVVIIIIVLLKVLLGVLFITPYGIHDDAITVNSLINGIRI